VNIIPPPPRDPPTKQFANIFLNIRRRFSAQISAISPIAPQFPETANQF